jgi:hypothetical protein
MIGNEKEPFTKISYMDEVLFSAPSGQSVDAAKAIRLVLVLLVSAAVAVIFLDALWSHDASWIASVSASAPQESFLTYFRPSQLMASFPTWLSLTFMLSVFSCSLGALFECYYLLKRAVPQESQNFYSLFIRAVRRLSIAPLVVSMFFASSCMLVSSAEAQYILLCVSFAACAALGFGLLTGGAGKTVVAGFLVLELLLIVLTLDSTFGHVNGLVTLFLVLSCISRALALLIGTRTYRRNSVFNILILLATTLFFMALVETSKASSGVFSKPSVWELTGFFGWCGLAISVFFGINCMVRIQPRSFNNFRLAVVNWLWTHLYLFLAGGPLFPNPVRLSDIYQGQAPPLTALKPYNQVHPSHLLHGLNIPSVINLEESVTNFKQLTIGAKLLFGLATLLDNYLPQTDISVPLKDKRRLKPWEDGSQYWPAFYDSTHLGFSIPGMGPAQTPAAVISAFKEGQLLAHLAESGYASALLEKAKGEVEGTLVIDLRDLEASETKPDYEGYGGLAYFKPCAETQRLKLISVVAPRTTTRVFVDPRDPVFRKVERLVGASMHFRIVVQKHLGEIHMNYNLLEVALHNAFDSQGAYNHPLRTALYIHLYSHELAEEMTTGHLVQDKAVLSQIFACTQDSMISCLNATYTHFQLGHDEDFEHRASMMQIPGKPDGELLPNSSIKWELEFVKIWEQYAGGIVDCVYPDDRAVEADDCLRALALELSNVFRNPIPERYHGLSTKKGITRFIIDTMHHLVVRHQILGTTGTSTPLDARINQLQVPKDGGTSGVDEYLSTMFVVLGTARTRFTPLMNDFKYLLDDLDNAYVHKMKVLFDELQSDLLKLESDWTADETQLEFNRNYYRVLPSEVHTGPGY